MLFLPSLHDRLIREEGYRGLIVGLTGDTSSEDVHHFREHGADAVMAKPFVIEEFNKIVYNFWKTQAKTKA